MIVPRLLRRLEDAWVMIGHETGRGCMESTYSHGGELFLVFKPLLVRSAAEEEGDSSVSFPVARTCIANPEELVLA